MQTEITQALVEAVKVAFDLDLNPGEVEISVPEGQHGDLATNLPFKLAKRLKMAPQEIAERLSISSFPETVEKAEAKGGFINLWLGQQYWVRVLGEMGASKRPAAVAKVQVEFISANPTGPLTLANARGGYLGDVLSNVLAHQGYEVVREYYVNDGGGQIEQLVEAVKAVKTGQEAEAYKGEYLQQLAEVETTPPALVKAIIDQHIRPAVARMGIEFDEWFYESSLVDQREQVIEQLAQSGLTAEADGALWLNTSKWGGDRQQRVLRKADGNYTYLANDLAYHWALFSKRGFKRAIKIWGADHAGQVRSLAGAVKQLRPEAELDFVILQMVRLMRGGKEVKVSKRAGTYVTIDELLDEIGSDVARFFFLMRSADTHLDFDLDLAKERSQQNPLFYVMYSYARANSILAQAAKRRLQPGESIGQLSDKERGLVRAIGQWPGLLQQVARDYGVHRLTFYGIELARLFHDYYEAEQIITLKSDQAAPKLYFVQQYKKFMQVYFGLLGITPQERM